MTKMSHFFYKSLWLHSPPCDVKIVFSNVSIWRAFSKSFNFLVRKRCLSVDGGPKKTKQKTVLISLYYHLPQRCAACHFHRLSQFLHSLQCTNIWVSKSINYIYYVSSMLTFPNKHEADGNTMISIGN